MEPRIESLAAKKLVGKQLTLSLTENKTPLLWQSFMPQRKQIINQIGTDLYSVEVYDDNYFSNFNPANLFQKWAAVAVADFNAVPPAMETLILPAGLYAVFIHQGPASQGAKTYQYIFTAWLPRSGYQLANRPHFAVMGAKYKGEDPTSEEELWIPIEFK
jgi:AraC family transcriptional regulator